MEAGARERFSKLQNFILNGEISFLISSSYSF